MDNIDKNEIIKELIDALEYSINKLNSVDAIDEYNVLNDKYEEFIEKCKDIIKSKRIIIKECPGDGNVRCIDCTCYLCDNNCEECNVENCEPKGDSI